MVEYRSDEERLSSIALFFNRNRSAIILITIACISLASFFSITKYFENTRNSAAYEIYDQWIDIISNPDIDLNEQAQANQLFKQLYEEYLDTGFGQIALIIRSSNLAENKNLDESLQLLYRLKDNTDGFFGNELFNLIARIGVARIEISLGNYQNAIDSLEGVKIESDNPMIPHLLGDALAGLNKFESALDHYKKALEISTLEEEKTIINYKIMQLNTK